MEVGYWLLDLFKPVLLIDFFCHLKTQFFAWSFSNIVWMFKSVPLEEIVFQPDDHVLVSDDTTTCSVWELKYVFFLSCVRVYLNELWHVSSNVNSTILIIDKVLHLDLWVFWPVLSLRESFALIKELFPVFVFDHVGGVNLIEVASF